MKEIIKEAACDILTTAIAFVIVAPSIALYAFTKFKVW